MSYVKQTWSDGDVITEEKLNHIEDGIESASEAGATVVHAYTDWATWADTTHTKPTVSNLNLPEPTDPDFSWDISDTDYYISFYKDQNMTQLFTYPELTNIANTGAQIVLHCRGVVSGESDYLSIANVTCYVVDGKGYNDVHDTSGFTEELCLYPIGHLDIDGAFGYYVVLGGGVE